MAGAVSMQMVGNWSKEVGVPLRDALAVSMDVAGRTGEEATKHALILMAQSAKKLVTTRRKTRPVQTDEHGKYVDVYTQGNRTPHKVYEWMFNEDRDDRIPGSWANARRIGNVGLAGRSWMWGLRRLGAKGKMTTAIPGTSRVSRISNPSVNGYLKENRLNYITKAMPPGWEAMVALTAGNKIMAQARKKMERQWASRLMRQEKAQMRSVQSFFQAVTS